MTLDVYPGLTGDVRMKAIKRGILEREVQNYMGPIRDIEKLSDSLLYGIRDSFAKAVEDNTEKVREIMQLDTVYEDSKLSSGALAQAFGRK